MMPFEPISPGNKEKTPDLRPQTVTERARMEAERRIRSVREQLYPENVSTSGRKVEDELRAVCCYALFPDSPVKEKLLQIGGGWIEKGDTDHPKWVLPTREGVAALADLVDMGPDELGINPPMSAETNESHAGPFFIDNPLPLLRLLRTRIDTEYDRVRNAPDSERKSLSHEQLERLVKDVVRYL